MASIIQREQPHVVALQEADGPSFWSGSFNHVEFLLDRTHLRTSYQGYHVHGMGLQYGTSIMSFAELGNTKSIRLKRSALTRAKGFVISSVNIQDLAGEWG